MVAQKGQAMLGLLPGFRCGAFAPFILNLLKDECPATERNCPVVLNNFCTIAAYPDRHRFWAAGKGKAARPGGMPASYAKLQDPVLLQGLPQMPRGSVPGTRRLWRVPPVPAMRADSRVGRRPSPGRQRQRLPPGGLGRPADRHSRASGNPEMPAGDIRSMELPFWIPACAGMTVEREKNCPKNEAAGY